MISSKQPADERREATGMDQWGSDPSEPAGCDGLHRAGWGWETYGSRRSSLPQSVRLEGSLRMSSPAVDGDGKEVNVG